MPCIVPREKLQNYLLNLAHPNGGPKARLFRAVGFRQDDLDGLAEALLAHAQDRDIEQEFSTVYGKKYVVKCHIPTPDGRAPCIVSVWFDDGDGHARLVSAYPT